MTRSTARRPNSRSSPDCTPRSTSSSATGGPCVPRLGQRHRAAFGGNVEILVELSAAPPSSASTRCSAPTAPFRSIAGGVQARCRSRARPEADAPASSDDLVRDLAAIAVHRHGRQPTARGGPASVTTRTGRSMPAGTSVTADLATRPGSAQPGERARAVGRLDRSRSPTTPFLVVRAESAGRARCDGVVRAELVGDPPGGSTRSSPARSTPRRSSCGSSPCCSASATRAVARCSAGGRHRVAGIGPLAGRPRRLRADCMRAARRTTRRARRP